MTVLNMIELTTVSNSFVYWTLILFIVGAALFGTGLVILCKDNDTSGAAPLAIGIVLIFIVIALAKCSDADIFQVPNGKFHIEATFSEDMPFLSVMENYNILEQRGDIFLLEPKASPIE